MGGLVCGVAQACAQGASKLHDENEEALIIAFNKGKDADW
jgi:hypothetical protein